MRWCSRLPVFVFGFNSTYGRESIPYMAGEETPFMACSCATLVRALWWFSSWLLDGKMHEEEEGRVCTDGFEQIAPCTGSPQKAGKTLKHTNATPHSSTNHHELQSLRREFNSLSNHNYTSVSRRLKALHGITIIIIITYWLILNDPLTGLK